MLVEAVRQVILLCEVVDEPSALGGVKTETSVTDFGDIISQLVQLLYGKDTPKTTPVNWQILQKNKHITAATNTMGRGGGAGI